MRGPVAAITVSVLLISGLGGSVSADHVPETPDYTFVDGEPLCGVAGDGGPATLAAGEIPTVATYNVLHSLDDPDNADVTTRLPLILDAMVDADTDASLADIWGLQEVTNNAEHGNVAELIAEGLAQRTGERWAWCWSLSNPHFFGEPELSEGGGGPLSELGAQLANFPDFSTDFREGLAFVTRLDIVDSRFRRLPPRAHEAALCQQPANPLDCTLPALFERRQLLWIRANAGPAGQIDVFNTHIAHGLTDHSDATKARQIAQALEYIDDWASEDALPDVFVGDFNSRPDSDDRYGLVIDAGFEDTYAESGTVECGDGTESWEGCTSHQPVLTDTATPNVSSRIDYVFARPGSCGLEVTGSTIIGTNAELRGDLSKWMWPSDHLGVVSEMTCDPA